MKKIIMDMTPQTPTPSGAQARVMKSIENESVSVFVLSRDPKGYRAALVAEMFSDNMFSTHVTSVSAPRRDVFQNDTATGETDYRRRFILEECKRRNIEHIVLVNDTSATVATPGVIADVVRSAISADFDIFYLGKHGEVCNARAPRSTIANSTISIHRAVDPQGLQAVYFNATARDAILSSTGPVKQTIRAKRDILNIGVASPSVITFDTALARNVNDYERTVECRQPQRGNDTLDHMDSFDSGRRPTGESIDDQGPQEGILFTDDWTKDSSVSAKVNPPLTMQRSWFMIVLLVVLFVLLVLLAVYFFAPQVRKRNSNSETSFENL